MGTVEVEFAGADGTVTVFFYHDFGDVWTLRFFVSIGFIFTVNKHHDVGVLLDRTRVAKVREARLATALLDGTREL